MGLELRSWRRHAGGGSSSSRQLRAAGGSCGRPAVDGPLMAGWGHEHVGCRARKAVPPSRREDAAVGLDVDESGGASSTSGARRSWHSQLRDGCPVVLADVALRGHGAAAGDGPSCGCAVGWLFVVLFACVGGTCSINAPRGGGRPRSLRSRVLLQRYDSWRVVVSLGCLRLPFS